MRLLAAILLGVSLLAPDARAAILFRGAVPRAGRSMTPSARTRVLAAARSPLLAAWAAGESAPADSAAAARELTALRRLLDAPDLAEASWTDAQRAELAGLRESAARAAERVAAGAATAPGLMTKAAALAASVAEGTREGEEAPAAAPAAARKGKLKGSKKAWEEMTPEERMLEDPVGQYEMYRARLRKDGPNASFPEFKAPLEEILRKLQSDEVRDLIAAHPDLGFELKEVLTQMFHVNLDFAFDDRANYPYDRPFTGPFPYRPTIDAIEAGLRLLDKVERLTNGQTVPLYHFNRYAYHRHSLLADPDIVIFPTLRSLSFQDLVRLRSVPLGLVGVVTETVRVDRHHQSPLDFWYHDLNHVRRMCAYIARAAAKRGARTAREKLKFYREMDRFVAKTLMPNIRRLTKAEEPDEEKRWIRSLMRVILFEILHETALTAEKDVILADLLRGANVPQPFEHMVLDPGFNPADIETQLRTDTGNLRSGADRALGAGMSSPTVIRYFHDRALSLLANVYNKAIAGFYDDVEDPQNYVAPVPARKARYLALAAQEIQRVLGAPVSALEDLEALVLSKEGSPEKFTYKLIAPHEADAAAERLPEATEPLSGPEAAARIRAAAAASGKKVHTLFGYSGLDYQARKESMARIRRELEGLDKDEWVVMIGATEEGIGGAYVIAKELGFETYGLVSTLGLTYGGRFSPHVDKIFIVEDPRWGGDGSPATNAFVEASDRLSFHGGGENSAAALRLAQASGKPWRFTYAEMNQVNAVRDARSRRAPPPTDFRGAAYREALRQGWTPGN